MKLSSIFWALLVLALAQGAPAAETVRFQFRGNILEKRPDHSVFAGDIGESFSGIFAYDLFAADEDPTEFIGIYPLLEFSIDGNDLNVPVGATIPFIPMVMIMRDPGLLSGTFEVRGFHVPATTDPNDNGSTSLFLTDFSGMAFPDDYLPYEIDLAAFDDEHLVGPSFGASPGPASTDQGQIMQMEVVPEPGVGLWLGLGGALLLGRTGRHRDIRPRS